MLTAVLIAVIALGTLYTAWRFARPRHDEPIDWTAPARDLGGADDAYDSAKAMTRGAPVVWSDTAGGYVCAAPAPHLPGEICGWPGNSCPDHGPRLRGEHVS